MPGGSYLHMSMPPRLNGQFGGEGGYDASSSMAGKRPAAPWGGGDIGDDSAEVDLLNRLVKRCRCDDSSYSSPAPTSPTSLMWEAPQ